MKKNIAVLLMGCGGVGRQLLQHVVSCRSLHAQQGLHLRIVGVCDSSSLVVASDVSTRQLDDSLLSEICGAKSKGLTLSALGHLDGCLVYRDSEFRSRVIDIASLLGNSTGLAFVDCSASSETVGMLTRAVDLGCCIVLANKKPLTSTMKDYEKLVSYPRRIRHESTVGAGLPVITSLTRLVMSGDTVNRVIGSLSGTLGYVMSEVEDGKPLSEVVVAAKSLGFTEPDPRDDLSGLDVARKVLPPAVCGHSMFGILAVMLWLRKRGPPLIFLFHVGAVLCLIGRTKALILARLLGRQISLDEINIESLYPDAMGPSFMSVEEFWSSGIKSLDNDIQERVKSASTRGNVLRYVCLIEGSRCEVGLQEIPKNSALGRLRGSDNVLEVYSRCYAERPLVIQGAGAGNDTTAAGVLADIIDLQDLFP